MSNTRATENFYENQLAKEEKLAKRKFYARVTLEGLIAGGSAGLALGSALAPLFPPLIIILPIIGAMAGAYGGYEKTAKHVLTKVNAGDHASVQKHAKKTQTALAATAGMVVGLALVAACPPLGIIAAIAIPAALSLIGISISDRIASKQPPSAAVRNISTSMMIGATIGFFIPIPGATLIGAAIGAGLYLGISKLHSMYNNYKKTKQPFEAAAEEVTSSEREDSSQGSDLSNSHREITKLTSSKEAPSITQESAPAPATLSGSGIFAQHKQKPETEQHVTEVLYPRFSH